MLSLGTEALALALGDLRRAVEFQDLVRLHFLEEADLSGHAQLQDAHRYVEARIKSPRTPMFQVYAHCASVTRLYAVYEAYVYDLVKSWLVELCALVETWPDLPESLCLNYRNGIGILLQKYGGPRTAHLTELNIVESLHKGLTGASGLQLVPEAFFIDLQNLRESELATLFSRVGLSDLVTWLKMHPDVRKVCDQYGGTVGSRLKELIDYRNDAAHGAIDVDEVIGISEFLSILEFVDVLCHALAEFVRHSLVGRAESKGLYQVVGCVTEFFASPQASIARMRPARIRRGDSVIVRSATECFVAVVKSIHADDADVEFIDAALEQELGLCFIPAVRRGLDLLVPATPAA